jgi:hypothetical protein
MRTDCVHAVVCDMANSDGMCPCSHCRLEEFTFSYRDVEEYAAELQNPDSMDLADAATSAVVSDELRAFAQWISARRRQ